MEGNGLNQFRCIVLFISHLGGYLPWGATVLKIANVLKITKISQSRKWHQNSYGIWKKIM